MLSPAVVEKRRFDKSLSIMAGVVKPLGVEQVNGCLFQFGGMRMYAFEVVGRMDQHSVKYDGWFYFQRYPEEPDDDGTGPTPLVVRWRRGRYQYIWEPAVLLFDAEETIKEWENSSTGRLPVCCTNTK